MNSSSNSSSCLGENLHVAVPVLLCLIIFSSFLLNSLSLWVFCCRLPRWTCGTTLHFHLALSDAISTPAAPMMAAYFSLNNHWPFGDFLCRLKIVLLNVHFSGSATFLTLISIHRYAAVVNVGRSSYLKRKPFVRKLCGGMWALLLLQGLLCGVLLPPDNDDGHRNIRCLSIHQTKLSEMYFLLNFLLLLLDFLLPFLVSAVCCARLANVLTRLNVRSARGARLQLQSQRTIGACLLIFAVCFLPLNVTRTFGVILNKYFPGQCDALRRVEMLYYCSWLLAAANSCLDPLLYCFGSQSFRAALGTLRRHRVEPTSRSNSELTPNF